MKNAVILLFSFLCAAGLKAQNPFAFTVPENLKEGASAVIRDLSQSFVQDDLYSGVYKESLTITVLNAKGDAFANFIVSEDSFHELKSFSGEIFNVVGKSIKKISKKDLGTTAFSYDLANDRQLRFYNFSAPSYPITVRYEYEMKFKNGILNYPSFRPVPGFRVSVEKSSYELKIPADFVLREKAVNGEFPVENQDIDKYKSRKWTFNNFAALTYEPYTPEGEVFPALFLAPEKFCAGTNCGEQTDWKAFGQWIYGLLEGRNSLPQTTIDKIHQLTDNLTDKREKVKALYEFLQNSTHYVSIQLGIGGWQPMTAEAVAKTGFGDCKGLVNYMKSLLDAVNIPSLYTVISTEKKRFFEDFPNFLQANHVILMVPLATDTIWLECTNQTLPFDYIHSGITGHQALIVEDNNSRLYTLPSYPNSANSEINKVEISLSGDGKALLTVDCNYKGDRWEPAFSRLNGADAKEENEFLVRLIKAPKPQISNFNKELKVAGKPELNISFTADCEDFASKTGTRLFIPVNPIYTSVKGYFSGNNRIYDIDLESGLYETDSIVLHIPEGYSLENAPKQADLQSDYGSFHTEVREENGKLIYVQKLELLPGRFPATEFQQIKDFYAKIENLQTAKVVLKKN